MGAIAATAVAVPLVLLAVFSRWGVLIALIVGALIGLAVWVRRSGFVFVEIVGFLIHFDGIGFGPVRMGRAVALIATLYIVAKLIRGWRPPAIPWRHWAPVWALGTWAALSALWSRDVGGFLYNAGVFGLGLVFFAITALLLENHRLIQQFLRAYWVGGLFGAGAGILALFLGTRSVGFGQDPNFFGLLLASMIPLTAYYRRHAPTVLLRHFYSLTLLVVIAGAAGAGSRSGLIGSTLAIVGTMVLRPGLSLGRRVGSGFAAVALAGVAALASILLNPAFAQRGLADRGAGRLDLWSVAISLIKENPVWGYGLGQLQALVPPNLLLTPGSQRLTERREDVSAHNTWLDVIGDLGVVGVSLFVLVFVVAIVGFLRPRWLETKELSTTLFVMMLPVLSGSYFLPLLNNKLAWALIGISAALAVPSAASRWNGLSAAPGRPPPTGAALVPDRVRGTSSELDRVTLAVGTRPHAPGEEVLPEVPLARWDLRPTRRAVRGIVAAAVLGAVLMGIGSHVPPASYTATAGLLVSNVDGSVQGEFIRTDVTRLQIALTMAISGAYAAELKELSGIDLPVEQIRSNMWATRPRMGFYIELEYTDTDLARVEAVQPHLLDAMDNVYAAAQEFAGDLARDQLRPFVPGETLVYEGPAYLRATDLVTVSENPPPTLWWTVIGGLVGALASTGVVLSRQRRPRVSPGDDLPVRIGMPVWARIGSGRRAAEHQFAHALASARASLREDRDVGRLAVTAPPGADRVAEQLVLALSCQLVGEGARVVLVDARGGRRSLAGVRAGRAGADDLAAALVPARRRSLPRSCRAALGERSEQLRVLPAGAIPAGSTLTETLERLDPSVTVLVLTATPGGPVSVSGPIAWADAVLIPIVVGNTVTHDLEDTAGAVTSFAHGASGVVAFSP